MRIMENMGSIVWGNLPMSSQEVDGWRIFSLALVLAVFPVQAFCVNSSQSDNANNDVESRLQAKAGVCLFKYTWKGVKQCQ